MSPQSPLGTHLEVNVLLKSIHFFFLSVGATGYFIWKEKVG